MKTLFGFFLVFLQLLFGAVFFLLQGVGAGFSLLVKSLGAMIGALGRMNRENFLISLFWLMVFALLSYLFLMVGLELMTHIVGF